MQQLRIATLRFGTGRQKMILVMMDKCQTAACERPPPKTPNVTICDFFIAVSCVARAHEPREECPRWS
jgi:hypothetical protein